MAGNLERSREVENLYQAAIKLEPGPRSALLGSAAPAVRSEVEVLLARSAAETQTIDPRSIAAAPGSMAAGAQPAIMGAQLGPYRVEESLGAGGMGHVYRALDTRLGRKVAIKFSAEQFNGRFEREARTISALNHPHICTLYDVGALPDGSTYLVTELVEGETLRDFSSMSPPAERSLEIARQVLEALRAAHGAGIVHRDLKPANIMVRFDGYVKVLDFGLAKRMPASEWRSGSTVRGREHPGPDCGNRRLHVAGTGPWARRQIRGVTCSRSGSFSTKCWPDGIRGLEVNSVDTMHAIFTMIRLRLVRRPSGFGLDSIVEKLLRKNPADRYQSAEAVLDALARPRA